MPNKDLTQLKNEYMNTPIPKELDLVVKEAFQNKHANAIRKNKFKRSSLIAASVAAAFTILALGVNTSPVFADALLKVPVVGSLVKVLTLKEYTINEDRFKANIQVPAIEGLENKALENSLNEKYLEQNKLLYEQFVKDIEDLKALGEGHMGVDSGYQVKTDNDRILSIGRYVVNTAASSSTTFQYDTIDKTKQILITLPSLFKNEEYIHRISENIKQQMLEQMKKEEGKIYWVEGANLDYPMELFDKISKEQSFYITDAGKLIISFNKYEVAPGYMGVIEFEIPTEVIADILVSDQYIK